MKMIILWINPNFRQTVVISHLHQGLEEQINKNKWLSSSYSNPLSIIFIFSQWRSGSRGELHSEAPSPLIIFLACFISYDFGHFIKHLYLLVFVFWNKMFVSTPLMSKYGYETNILLVRTRSNGQWFVNSCRVFYRDSG